MSKEVEFVKYKGPGGSPDLTVRSNGNIYLTQAAESFIEDRITVKGWVTLQYAKAQHILAITFIDNKIRGALKVHTVERRDGSIICAMGAWNYFGIKPPVGKYRISVMEHDTLHVDISSNISHAKKETVKQVVAVEREAQEEMSIEMTLYNYLKGQAGPVFDDDLVTVIRLLPAYARMNRDKLSREVIATLKNNMKRFEHVPRCGWTFIVPVDEL